MSTLFLGVGIVVFLVLFFSIVASISGPKQDRDIEPIPGLKERQALSEKHAKKVGRSFVRE